MKASVLYSNAVISSRSNKLLNTDRVKRMIQAPSEEEAAKILLECGYNEGLILNYPDRCDIIINDELKNTVETFKKLCSDENLLNYVLTKFDYHNAKTIFKSTLAPVNLFETTYPFGKIDYQKLKDSIIFKKYNNLSASMRQVFAKLNEETALPASADIDKEITRAMYEELTSYLNQIKDKNVKLYLMSEIDVLNLQTFAKVRQYGANKAQAKELFVSGGSLTEKDMMVVLNDSTEKIKNHFFTSFHKELIKKLCECLDEGDITDFEDFSHVYLIKISRKNSGDVFSVSYLFNWFVLKLEEVKFVKFILVGKRFNLSRKQFRDALNDAYEEFN